MRADFRADWAITWSPLEVDAEPIFDARGLCVGVAWAKRNTVVMRPKTLQELIDALGIVVTPPSADAGIRG